jgi:polyferredoxin
MDTFVVTVIVLIALVVLLKLGFVFWIFIAPFVEELRNKWRKKRSAWERFKAVVMFIGIVVVLLFFALLTVGGGNPLPYLH